MDRLRDYPLVLVLACVAVGISPTLVRATTAVPHTALTVRVYQKSGLSSTLEQRALAEAETVLRAALVEVRWQVCTGLSPSPACDVPPGPFELLLVVRNGPPRQDRSAPLGDALVVPCAGGVLATVYVNHVASLANVAKTDVAVLLGRVAAHELGHLMMHTSTHARSGLMRPHWTPEEVRLNRAGDWTFTAGDVAAIRQRGREYSRLPLAGSSTVYRSVHRE